MSSYYFGGAYETRSNGSEFKYYSFGGQSIVNEKSAGTDNEWTLSYLLTDHLGSVVAVTDASGTLLSQQRYLPFGGERPNIGTISQTDYGYTGQRDLEMGLMDYNARYYSPLLGRFTQPDSLISHPFNPQTWNRYSYVINNPILYIDPSGHAQCKTQEDCEDMGTTPMGESNSTSGNGDNGGDSGFSDDDLEDILAIAEDGDFVTYIFNGDTRVAMFALDAAGNLVLYDVDSKSLINLDAIAPFGSGFYTYNVARGEYELNPAVEALAVNQDHLNLINPQSYYVGGSYIGEYNVSIEYNYYYDYTAPDFVVGNFWLVVSTFAAVTVATGGLDLIPIGAGVIADVSLNLIFGGQIDPDNPMDVRISPVQPLPPYPPAVSDPQGYFFPLPR